MENEAKSVKFVNYTYRFSEMESEIENSINNVDNVIKEHKKLIAILDTDEHKEDFAEFVKSLYEQVNVLEEQKRVMSYRLECLKHVINLSMSDDTYAFLVSMLLECIGLENKEAKIIEEVE